MDKMHAPKKNIESFSFDSKKWGKWSFWIWIVTIGLLTVFVWWSTTHPITPEPGEKFDPLTYVVMADIVLGVLAFIVMVFSKANRNARIFLGLCFLGLFVVALIGASNELKKKQIEEKLGVLQTATVVPSQTPSPTIKPTAQPTKKPNIESRTQTSTEKLPVLNGGTIFGLINKYRGSNNKPYWSVSDELCRLAEQRAEYLIQPTYEDFVKNTYPSFKNHPGFQDMAGAFNYSGIGLSENLAMGAKSDADVLNMWKNSPPHNALMLATDHNGTTYTKACIATRVKYYGSITVLLAGDK